METCVRGFSYMPEQVSVQSLVEEEELERTWRSRRRQRAKEQEEKIWLEFVNEKDVVGVVSQDDPYQFLQRLPESCIKELLETELPRAKTLVDEQEPESECEVPKEEQNTANVEETDRDEGEMFHIYDDDDDEKVVCPTVMSDNEEAVDTRSSSPHTARELDPPEPCLYDKPDKNVSENVSNVIQSSIYCAKVKDLRSKIREEVLTIINSLEMQELTAEEPGRARRCSEFCSRFNRIYMYQLKRQMDDLKRNTEKAPPFAKHTNFHAQMIRVASLHQHLLQSFQVFHKSMSGGGALHAACGVLHALAHAARDVSSRAALVPAPRDLRGAAALYSDDMLESLTSLDEAVCHHSLRFSSLVATEETSRSQLSNKKQAKRRSRSPKKSVASTRTIPESKLSMYSLDTLRLNLNGKSSAKHPYGTVKNLFIAGKKVGAADKSKNSPIPKKTPRSRRPLMRAGGGAPRPRPRVPKDGDISTMVEGVEMLSSHMSRSNSPRETPRSQRLLQPDARKLLWQRQTSPKPRLRHTPQQLIKALTSITNNNSPTTPRSDKRKTTPRDKTIADKTIEVDKLDKIDLYDKADLKVNSARSEGVAKLGDFLKKEGYQSAVNSARNNGEKRAPIPSMGPAGEVSRLLKQLCSGDSSASEISGAKNAQLHFVTGSSPRPPSTPQLLKILETTIKKKVPRSMYGSGHVASPTRHRLQLSAPRADSLLQYRTRFVQHMLASSLYANSAVGKPWELVSSLADKLIEELMMTCVKEMQIKDAVLDLFRAETK